MRHRKANLTIEGAPLITIPVGLANATKSVKDVSLSIVFEDGRKAETVYRNPATGEITSNRPPTRGVKIGKDEKGDLYGLVDTEAWDELNSKIKLHVLGFCEREELANRMERISAVHYVQVQPGFDAGALGLVIEAMWRQEVVAVVRFAVGGKERLGVLMFNADGDPIVVTLQYAEHMAEADNEVKAAVEVTPNEEAVKMAEQLIEEHRVEGAVLDTMRDELTAERMKLVEAAAKGEKPLPRPEAEESPTTDVEAAIMASLGAAKPKGKAKAKAAATA